ncbi:MAG: OsmC family protein [Deltaproteobacteria bacterium]|nr:OsmC family protein [Deltaproteobacteria bacterium]MCL5276781.1 OsmC family protein [Deltaproteobacteria bacterium]
MPGAEIVWKEGMRFEGTSDSGHTVVMDAGGPPDGTDTGARPMELLLIGLGGCTGMDVVSILKKMRKHVTYFKLNIRAERSSEHPKVYTKINLEYLIEGDMEDGDVKRAVGLSQDKFCSVSAMLGKTADIAYTYKLLKAEDRKP